MDQESGKVAPETVPVRAERTFEQGPEKPKRDRSADRITELGPNKSSLERSSEREKKGAKEKERIPPKSPPSIKSPSRSPSIVTATVGDSTAAKPTTPPGSPREEQAADEEESGNQSADDLFEPLTPDRSPSNLFMSDDEEPEDVREKLTEKQKRTFARTSDNKEDGYEEILSDEEDMEDGTLDDTDVTFGELDVYSEDAWMSVSVSFNPYQCDLSILTAFTPPDSTEHEKAVLKASEDSCKSD
ncbi:uncharacterized protein [Montipora capricornis]|uniref:uncharacterized protein n=1 Tax=Montipora capricornis TaxID=246305 RepID=UPI0035F1BF57